MVTRKVIPIKPITAWSYSRWSEYELCPAKFKYKNIDKLKEPPNAAMERGAAIHKLAEDYTNGKLRKLPKELSLFKEEFADLKKQKIKYVEDSWAFKSDWTPTEWNDWNGVWLRAKLDALYVMPYTMTGVFIDHKTGKYQERKHAEYETQLQLYGLVALKRMPELKQVTPQLWYLDEGVIYPNADAPVVYTRDDEKYLDKLWRGRVKKLLSDTTFKATPNNLCSWCHYRKSNGGPCAW